MILTIAITTLLIVLSVCVMLSSIRNAPMGYEDAEGFHFESRPGVVYYDAFSHRQSGAAPSAVNRDTHGRAVA